MSSNKLFFKFAIFFIFSTIASQAFSQQDSVDIYDLSLEELMGLEVEIASKNSQKISEAPAIVGIVTKKDIENMGVTSLADVLKHIPSMDLSIGVLGQYRLSIRGQRKDGNILMLIDGQPFNDFYNGLSLYDIPVDFIEKIEIIRGPGSALFGTNAVAGVINIISNKSGSSVTLRGGMYTTYSGAGTFSKKVKNTTFSLGGGYVATDGANTHPRSDSIKTEKTNRWLNDAFFRASITNDNLNVALFGIMRNSGAWASPAFEVTPDSELKNNMLLGEASYNFNISKNIVITPKVYSQYIDHDYLIQEQLAGYQINGNIYTDGAFTSEQYKGLKLGSELQVKMNFGKNFNLVTGGVYENLHLLDYNLRRNYSLIGGAYHGFLDNHDDIVFEQKNKQRDILAYFVQAEYRLKKVALTSGFRFDSYSDFGYSINPRLGFVFNATKNFNMKLLYGKAFRAPLFIELYDNTNYSKEGIIGNEDLMPENIHSSEMAFEFSKSKFLVRANFFYNYGNNTIGVLDIDGDGSYGYYENIGTINSVGSEIEVIVIMNSSLDFFVNFSNFYSIFEWDSEITDNPDNRSLNYFVETSGKFIPVIRNIPNIRANAGLNYKYSSYSFFASINYGSASRNNARYEFEYNAPTYIDAYILGNMNLSYSLKRVKFSVLANNLGLVRYADPEESTNIDKMGQAGMAQPLFSVMGRVSVNLDSRKRK